MAEEKGSQSKLLYKEESYRIRGAVYEVYKNMGCGFLEAVYQECLEREFVEQKIPFIPQKELNVSYKGVTLIQFYKADFVCFDKIVLELKAVKELADEHRAQLFNYLKATNFRLGFLINFGHHLQTQIERIVI
jgi:GxxExxY protein